MTIKTGDRIPQATLNTIKDGVQAITTDDMCVCELTMLSTLGVS